MTTAIAFTAAALVALFNRHIPKWLTPALFGILIGMIMVEEQVGPFAAVWMLAGAFVSGAIEAVRTVIGLVMLVAQEMR